MSLADQIKRVDGSQNDILKTLLSAFGVAVGENKIDQLSALAKTADNLKENGVLSNETKEKYGLEITAVPDDVLAILSKAALVGADGSLSTASGDAYSTPKIEFTSYLGNGTGGPSNPCSVVFSFKPDLIYLYAVKLQSSSVITPTFTAATTGVYMIDISEYTNQFSPSKGFNRTNSAEYALSYGKFDESLNELSWYDNSAYVQGRPINQLNISGNTYFLVAVKGE